MTEEYDLLKKYLDPDIEKEINFGINVRMQIQQIRLLREIGMILRQITETPTYIIPYEKTDSKAD